MNFSWIFFKAFCLGEWAPKWSISPFTNIRFNTSVHDDFWSWYGATLARRIEIHKYKYLYIYMERHLLFGAIYGATFATWATFATCASSGLRYMQVLATSLHADFSDMKILATCTHMHIFLHFHNAPLEIKSSAPLRGQHPMRSMQLPGSGLYI